MEVVTIITSDKKIASLFDIFVYSFSKIYLVTKDQDTAFFNSSQASNEKLYYHFILNDVEKEFSYNYEQTEINQIKKFFGEKDIYLFDLSYSSENLLTLLFKGFKEYLTHHNRLLIHDILISHPFVGIKHLTTDY